MSGGPKKMGNGAKKPAEHHHQKMRGHAPDSMVLDEGAVVVTNKIVVDEDTEPQTRAIFIVEAGQAMGPFPEQWTLLVLPREDIEALQRFIQHARVARMP